MKSVPCSLSQINPTRHTILFNMFIYFSSLHVSVIHVLIIGRKLLYLCDAGIFRSVWVATGLLVGLKLNRIVHLVGLIYEIIQGCTVNKT